MSGTITDPDCIFCRIVAGELPAAVVNRGEGLLAFRDINPVADTHVLVVPHRHLATFREVRDGLDADEAKRMLDFVAETATVLGLEDYRLMIAVGPGGGQTVFHLHWHLLGGTIRRIPL